MTFPYFPTLFLRVPLVTTAAGGLTATIGVIVIILRPSTGYRREYTDQVEALKDLEQWQLNQVLHGIGSTALIAIPGGWAVEVSADLTEVVLGF